MLKVDIAKLALASTFALCLVSHAVASCQSAVAKRPSKKDLLETEAPRPRFCLSAEQVRVLSWLNLNKSACLAVSNIAVNLPPERGGSDAFMNVSPSAMVVPYLLPALDAPENIYAILRRNKIVQTVFDIEIDSDGLAKNCILTFEKPDSRLLHELSKLEHGQSNSEQGGQNSWNCDGKMWHILGLDASHVLISTQAKEHHGPKRIRFKAAGADAETLLDDKILPTRLKTLLRDMEPDAQLWQVLDTTIVPKESTVKYSRQLEELATSGTTAITSIGRANEEKTTVHSSDKTAPEMLRRELSDFKEPAEFSLAQSIPESFQITIAGDDARAIKAKTFLLLLLGPLTAL